MNEDSIEYQIEHQFQVYESSQGLVPLADAKAGAIIAANLGLIATIANAPFVVDKIMKIINAPSDKNSIIFFLLAFFLFGSICSIVTGLMVLYPRPSKIEMKMKTPHLTFYENILNCGNPEKYYNNIKSMNPDIMLQEMCVQNFELAKILQVKYQFSKISLSTFVITLVLWLIFLYKVFIIS
ncbi:MAG: DUF5706 domain-containing protein [Candidatus Wallbacteria bacterium]